MTPLQWPFVHGRGIEIARADGVYLTTATGDKILDAAGGAVVANIGWGRQRVADAVARATLETTYVVPPWRTPSRNAMLEELSQWLPSSFTRVHGTSGGSDANEAALKIALQYQQAIGAHSRTKIIGRSVSYHGTTLATAAVSGHPQRKRGIEGALQTFIEVDTPYPLRCPLGMHHEDTGQYYLDQLRDTIEATGPEHIAAFIAEPITGSSGGAIVPPDDYWPAVRSLCDRYGIVLIMDEVMTGFGRTGHNFGFQHWPLEPDIFVSGKGLAGGYAPLGGVFAREVIGAAIQDAGFPVMFNTFGAHPAACAAAAEVLAIMREENLVARVRTLGKYIGECLNAAFAHHPNIAECRGTGLLHAIEVVADRDTLEPFPLEQQVSNRIVAKGLEKGVFYYGGGTGVIRDIVCMGPAFVISESEIDTMIATLADCVDEVVAAL